MEPRKRFYHVIDIIEGGGEHPEYNICISLPPYCDIKFKERPDFKIEVLDCSESHIVFFLYIPSDNYRELEYLRFDDTGLTGWCFDSNNKRCDIKGKTIAPW
jgi:hypothetical protein